MSNIHTLLGIDNAQNSSHNIDAQKLAEELRVENYRFPENAYKQAEAAVKELIPLIFGMNSLKQEEFGPYLVANQGQLFTILGKYPEIFRFPLIFTEEASQSYLREALDQGVDFGVIEVGARACLGFYFYARSLRSQADLADEFRGNLFSFIYNIRNNLVIFARKVCTAELEGVWGDRDKDFFHTLFPENDPVKMRFLDQFHRPSNIVTPEQKMIIDEERFRFWSQAGLAPDRLLVAVPDLILLKGKGILSQETIQERQSLRDVVPPLDLPALNFFLCQNHLEAYEYFLTKVIANKDYYPVWKLWIRDNIGLLLDNTSQAYRVFQLVWHLEGDIFNASGGLSSDAKKRIPKDLQNVILGAAPKNAGDKLKRTVSNIPMPVQSNTAMSALLAQPVQPTKITIPPLDIKTILPDFEKSKKDNKQLTQIDFSGCDFPEGTTVQVQRRLPSKKKPVFEMIVDIDPRGKNTIKPVLGQGIQGHFGYSITVSLPSTHCFGGANSIEVSYYAKAEPTPLEIEAERARREELNNQSKAAPTPVAPVAEKVVEKVEKIIDPADTSLIAAAFVLEANLEKYSNNDMYEGGPIEIVISDADASEVLGDDSESLLPTHRTWTIQEDGTIHPHTDNTDICDYLFSIKEILHTKVQEGRERQQKEENQLRDQAEYEQERGKFTSILDFARGFQFEGKQNGHFEDQKEKLRTELRALGWSLPVPLSGSQVIWRHIESKVRILYTSKQCVSFAVNGEQSELTGSQKKCYEEVAQAFSHIARFFNVEAKERTRMVNKEKAIRKETETGAVACDKHLQDGRARLVLFGAYRGGHGIWSSKFPTEKTPYMLDVRASYQNIEAILEQYPHAELCYCRDKLCINGEIDKDAGEGSVENTLQNIHDLRNSPRARYILKKRILITYKLEKFSGETDRAPIKHEKNKKEGTVSALDILLDIKEKKNIQSAADITEDFLNYYIDELERNRIRVHYVWPLSARLDEHQARIKKYTAKGVASEERATAD